MSGTVAPAQRRARLPEPEPRPNRNRRDERGTLLTRLALALLGLWCVLGAATTAVGLLDEGEGWFYSRDPGAGDVVGIPLVGADDVTALRRLLAAVGRQPNEPWLVVYPPGTDPVVLGYIRAQLLYFEYPERIDVIALGDQPPLRSYARVVTPPGIEFTDLGEPLPGPAGFRIYPGFEG